MSKTTYTINYKNSASPDITLSASTLNTTSLPIKLVGPSYIPKTADDISWGEVIQENALWMLENFNSNVEPTNAPDGMLWYDPSTKTLKLRYDSGTSGSPSKSWANVVVAGSLPPGASPLTVANNIATIADQPLVLPKNTSLDAAITVDDDYAATRGWVKGVVQDPGSATPQVYGSASKDDSLDGKNNVHYYMLPGNFMMVWGNALGKFRPTQVKKNSTTYDANAPIGVATTTLSSAESTIIGATITFADYGIPDFNDTSYSVTVSEVVPKMSAPAPMADNSGVLRSSSINNNYYETTGFLRRTNLKNWAGYNKVGVENSLDGWVGNGLPTSKNDNRQKTYSKIHPLTFIVYDKTPKGFKIHATCEAEDKYLYSSWARFLADCNFTAIGHKKP